MDYTSFETYPLQILGINDSYNDELTATEALVISEIDYSGNVDDLVSVLPYFVFFKFCENRFSAVDAMAGEQKKVSEFSAPSIETQVRVWNIGAKKLAELCALSGETANCIYQSQRDQI